MKKNIPSFALSISIVLLGILSKNVYADSFIVALNTHFPSYEKQLKNIGNLKTLSQNTILKERLKIELGVEIKSIKPLDDHFVIVETTQILPILSPIKEKITSKNFKSVQEKVFNHEEHVLEILKGLQNKQFDKLKNLNKVNNGNIIPTKQKEFSLLVEDIFANHHKFPKLTQVNFNDTNYANAWYLKPLELRVTSVGAYGHDFEGAWNITSGKGQVVAVIDTGVLPHPDLGSLTIDSSSQFISDGYDFISDCRNAGTCDANTNDAQAVRKPQKGAFDYGTFVSSQEANTPYFKNYGCGISNSVWHGTNVTSVIAAKANNGQGFVGGAYNSKIVPVRVLGKCGGMDSDILESILWSANLHATLPNPHPANVINMSLGGTATCSAAYRSVFDRLSSKNISVVIAAGNEQTDANRATPGNCNSKSLSFPFRRTANNLFNVGSNDKNGEIAYYSNYNQNTNMETIDVSAYGGDLQYSVGDTGVYVADSKNTNKSTSNAIDYSYSVTQGTSFAAPQVSSLIALLKSIRSTWSHETLKNIIKGTATLMPKVHQSGNYTFYNCVNNRCGAGTINAKLAVQAAVMGLAPIADNVGGKGAILFDLSETTTKPVDSNNAIGLRAFVLQNVHNRTLQIQKVFLRHKKTGTVIANNSSSDLFNLKENCSNKMVFSGSQCTVNIRYFKNRLNTNYINQDMELVIERTLTTDEISNLKANTYLNTNFTNSIMTKQQLILPVAARNLVEFNPRLSTSRLFLGL